MRLRLMGCAGSSNKRLNIHFGLAHLDLTPFGQPDPFSIVIRFVSPSGKKNSPPHGNVIVYFGQDIEAFKDELGQYGRIVIVDDKDPGASRSV